MYSTRVRRFGPDLDGNPITSLRGLLNRASESPRPRRRRFSPILLILGFLLALAFVNFRGMRESMWLNLVCTTVEAAGLVIVIAVGIRFWGSVGYIAAPAPNVVLSVKAPAEAMAWMGGGSLRRTTRRSESR